MILKETERLDDLGDGVQIIQSSALYTFTSDSVLLANFANVKKSDLVADYCTGSGIVAILLAKKYQPQKIYAVELQPEMADMCLRSVEYNGLNECIEVLNESVQGFGERFPRQSRRLFDVITVNPPYGKKCTQFVSQTESAAIARHETALTLCELLDAVKATLTFRGRVVLVYPCERLAELIHEMKLRFIEPKRLQLVCPKRGAAPNVALIEGVYRGAEGLKVLPVAINGEE